MYDCTIHGPAIDIGIHGPAWLSLVPAAHSVVCCPPLQGLLSAARGDRGERGVLSVQSVPENCSGIAHVIV